MTLKLWKSHFIEFVQENSVQRNILVIFQLDWNSLSPCPKIHLALKSFTVKHRKGCFSTRNHALSCDPLPHRPTFVSMSLSWRYPPCTSRSMSWGHRRPLASRFLSLAMHSSRLLASWPFSSQVNRCCVQGEIWGGGGGGLRGGQHMRRHRILF